MCVFLSFYFRPGSGGLFAHLQVHSFLQDGAPAEEDLKSWGHHSATSTVPDSIMRTIGEELPGQVSFIFTCKASDSLAISVLPCPPATVICSDMGRHACSSGISLSHRFSLTSSNHSASLMLLCKSRWLVGVPINICARHSHQIYAREPGTMVPLHVVQQWILFNSHYVSAVLRLQVAGKAIEGEGAEEVHGSSAQRSSGAGPSTPVTPAVRPAARTGLSAATASAPSRMLLAAPSSSCTSPLDGAAGQRTPQPGTRKTLSYTMRSRVLPTSRAPTRRRTSRELVGV